MKVTLLIAMCTLVVLLQQMQAPMAKPLDIPQEVDELSEWIMCFHSMWASTGHYIHVVSCYMIVDITASVCSLFTLVQWRL